jgi:hypothetical protein
MQVAAESDTVRPATMHRDKTCVKFTELAGFGGLAWT